MSERTLILARSAAERGRLLHSLLGVDEAALMTVPVFSDWSAANLLAHIGDYDRFYAERLELVLNGSEDQIESIEDLDARNTLLQTRIKDWTLEFSVDYLEKARLKFLTAFEALSDEDYQRELTFSWGMPRISGWVEWRHKHDAVHTNDLQVWRETHNLEDWNGPKSILMAALRAARADLLTTIALVPLDQRESLDVCGHWTLKDVAGHLADWSTYFGGCVATMCGQSLPEGFKEPSEDFNEERYLIRRDFSWIKNWGEFNGGYIALREMLDKLTDDELNQRRFGTPYGSIYECAWSALEHDLDHAAGMRAALTVDMPTRLLTFSGPFT
ncbi:MAG: DinB family protein [Chitinophagaceae bacterium]|nr:DinB family protein [Anaerolineae bacterium]